VIPGTSSRGPAPGAGVHWFVAWRYLLARPRRISGPVLSVIALCVWVLAGFGLAVLWYPLADEILSPFRPIPWWLLATAGLLTAWTVGWLLMLPVRYAIYRRFGGVAIALPGLITGLAALSSFGVFGFFHRPYGTAGPAEISKGWLIAAAVTLVYLVVSSPLLWRWWRRGLGAVHIRGEVDRIADELGVFQDVGARVTTTMIRGLFHGLAALDPVVRRYGASVLVGLNLGLIGLLAGGAGWAVWKVIWPARELVPYGSLLGWIAGAAGVNAVIWAAGGLLARSDRLDLARFAVIAAVIGLAALAVIGCLYLRVLASSELPASAAVKLPLSVTIPMLVALVLLPLSILLAAIRYFFTFFSTVSIGGVAIGSMALVIVLSVMSGFENDLRRKILGSNAHMLVTKATDEPMICRALPELGWRRCTIDVEAAFTEYRRVGEAVARAPGVIAQSPYLISEVVIAANNNYANVIIKGVDPETVGEVGELDENTETPDALARLWPLNEDGSLRGPPAGGEAPAPDGDPDRGPEGPDPAPIDFGAAEEGAPIDFGGDGEAGQGGAPDAGAREGPEPGDSGGAAPGDLDVPDDDTPIDFGDVPGDARLPDPDEIFTLDIPGTPQPGDFAPGSAGALELSAKIPPRVAILPGVLVGRELVKQINLYDGQEVEVVSPLGQDTPLGPVPRTKPFRVAGVFFTGMYEYDLKFIYVEIGALQDFLDLGDEVTGIEIRVADPTDTDSVVARLVDQLGPAYRIQDWKELNRSLFSALKLEKIAMFLVLAIIILVASFSIVGNLIMVVIEKAREIAVIKTLGASDAGVMKIFVTQGFFIGLVGTVVGVSLGLLACWAGIVFGLPLDPDVYYIDKLPIHIEPTSVIAVAAAGIVISVIATVYPAYIAARLRPIHGLRYE
jgi:lipoprotein-releasing system permease protein